MRNRSTTDLLILMVAGTVCFAVLAAGAGVAAVEIAHPEVDTTSAQNSIGDVINTLIGLLAGFLAGRTQVQVERTKQERRDAEPGDE